jgi:hypothetical protein
MKKFVKNKNQTNILFFCSLNIKNEKQKFVRCCLIFENSKEYCKRILQKNIDLSFFSSP